MKTKKLLVLLLALVLLLLAACSGPATGNSEAPTQSAAVSGNDNPSSGAAGITTASGSTDRIIVSSEADGGTLDPFTQGQWGSVVITGIIFEHLIQVDPDGTIHMGLAKSIEQVDDTHYAVTLWDDIFDTDGNQLTTSDVAWCYQMLIDLGQGGAISKFDGFEIEDKFHMTMVLKSPFTAGDYAKTFGDPNVLCQAAYEEHGGSMVSTPVGTGPYRLKEYTPGSSVILTKNEDYWVNNHRSENDFNSLSAQNFQEIEIQVIQDASSRAIALELGTIDVADSLNGTDVDYFTSSMPDDISAVLENNQPPVSFTFNCSDSSPCGDVNLRKAICYALDNAAIAEGLDVIAYPVYGIAPNLYDAPAEWLSGRDYYEHNLDMAKQLLEQSNYHGETLKVVYVSSDAAYDGVALFIHSQLRDLGITVEIEALEQSVANIAVYDFDAFDIKLERCGGGNYLAQVLKRWTGAEQASHFENGENNAMVADAVLDELYNAVNVGANGADADAIAAWDAYFTGEVCYGYAVCGYYNQTAARSYVNVALNSKNEILPNASSFK